ncbi:hypothetical protein L083_4479 [Actinoplanes sp. N902-109]|nr:hypothetical protein L083_4479 [Actinoplanes sp. N902-109]
MAAIGPVAVLIAPAGLGAGETSVAHLRHVRVVTAPRLRVRPECPRLAVSAG